MLALVPVLAGAPARAQAPADSLPSGIEIVGSSSASAPTRAHADTVKKQSWSAQPRVVMMRSLLIPGWGQAYNHAWYKAGAVAAGEVWLGVLIAQDQKALNDLSHQIDQLRADSLNDEADALVPAFNDKLDQRIAKTWIFAAILTYAMVDAYVDAHFRGFELEFKHDPALPAGPPPAGSSGGGGGTTRLGLRWHF